MSSDDESGNEDHIVDNIISSEEEEADLAPPPAVPRSRNGTVRPEPEIIEISEDDEDPPAVDADLQRAISESLKESSRKRNLEAGTSGGEEPKRANLSFPASADVDEALAGLLDELRSKIACADEFRRVRERLERKKGKVSAEHLESAALRELIDEQRNAMKLDTGGEETYEYVVVVLDALRRHSEPQEDADQLLAEEVPLVHNKHGPKIRELMVKLDEYKKKVERLRDAENDDADEESAFIQRGRYKKRILQIHSRLAKLQDCYDPMRKYKTVKFRGSRYPEIDAQITEYINGRLSQGEEPQPNFRKVKQLVEIANEERKLAMPDYAVELEAKETFDAVVKKLKARRMKETLDRLEEDYLDPSQRADPAASDPELARKLAEEHRDPVEQERRVLEEFRLKSAELVEKEDVEDEDKELSDVESEVSAKAGDEDDDDFDLDAIIMMTSDEEDAVVDSSEQSQIAVADK